MKIGILTLPFNNNYGGLLQAFALQEHLRERGHEPYLVHQPFFGPKERLKSRVKRILRWHGHADDRHMRAFEAERLVRTRPVRTPPEFAALGRSDFDAFVVGSDQVWRFEYTGGASTRYFLDFVPTGVKKIAFAASFGVDTPRLDETTRGRLAHLLGEFTKVSVRETSGTLLCRDLLGRPDAVALWDPTLLHAPEFYRRLYPGTEEPAAGVGAYLLDPEMHKTAILETVGRRLALPTHPIGKRPATGFGAVYPSVGQWIRDFDTAKFIVTDSFHGMVFAILFRKPFCVIGNRSRGLSRFESILGQLGMTERLITEPGLSEVRLQSILESPLDLARLDAALSRNRADAHDFLASTGL